MKIIEIKRRADRSPKDYIKRSASEGDYSRLIEEPCIITENGVVKVIYDHFEGNTADIVKALRKIKYATGRRSRGLLSTSRVFGYTPRNEMRQDYCSATSLAREAPKEHALVCDLALRLEEHYKRYNPEGWEKHKALTDEKVKDDWRMGGKSIFTSGIINKNNPLKYHNDSGNFNDVYSLMIVFKGGVEGGYLSLPEYDIAFKLPNNSLFMFDGQGLLHGVTPIKYTSDQAYRFSIVYYTLKRMWQCLEPSAELARIQERKTTRERTRMEVPPTQEERDLKVKNEKMIKDRIGKQ